MAPWEGVGSLQLRQTTDICPPTCSCTTPHPTPCLPGLWPGILEKLAPRRGLPVPQASSQQEGLASVWG